MAEKHYPFEKSRDISDRMDSRDHKNRSTEAAMETVLPDGRKEATRHTCQGSPGVMVQKIYLLKAFPHLRKGYVRFPHHDLRERAFSKQETRPKIGTRLNTATGTQNNPLKTDDLSAAANTAAITREFLSDAPGNELLADLAGDIARGRVRRGLRGGGSNGGRGAGGAGCRRGCCAGRAGGGQGSRLRARELVLDLVLGDAWASRPGLGLGLGLGLGSRGVSITGYILTSSTVDV